MQLPAIRRRQNKIKNGNGRYFSTRKWQTLFLLQKIGNNENVNNENRWACYRQTMANDKESKRKRRKPKEKRQNYYRIHYYDKQFHGTQNCSSFFLSFVVSNVAKKRRNVYHKWICIEHTHCAIFAFLSECLTSTCVCLCAYTLIPRRAKQTKSDACAILNLVDIF